ncbi:phosphoenolpyruvate carboxykinase domain-containing protein [Buchananella felis]|uniref:phosphoenolpyruvate carboxykinase domain-containing protein n=1 Tax=Buchananella felis TaxID=3231492 RepID=UPI003528CB17
MRGNVGTVRTQGLMKSQSRAELFKIEPERWLAEADLTEEYLEQFGDKVPAAVREQLAKLRERAGA